MKSKILQIFLIFVLALSLTVPVEAGLLKKTRNAVIGAAAAKIVKDKAKKVVENATIKHASKVVAGTAAAGSASKILRSNMDKIPEGFAAHHIIPVQLQNHPMLTKIGFDINQAINGIALPRYRGVHPDLSIHAGRHSVYTNGVKEALDSIPKHLSNTQVQNLVHKIIEICRKKLSINTPIHKREGAHPALWNIKGELNAYIPN